MAAQSPTLRSSWPLFAWLFVTAILLYYAKWPILIVAALVGWVQLCRGYPLLTILTAGFLRGVIRGLFSRR